MIFIENQSYNYKDIEQYTVDRDLLLIELGDYRVGENFLIIKYKNKDVISFVCTGLKTHGYIYQCCYTDR